MLRRLVVIATFFVFLFTGLKQNNVTTETYAYSEVMSEEDNTKATVTIYFMLKNGEGSGTGVVWDITEEGKLIILTAKHCVDYDEPSIIAVVFDNGEIYIVNDICMSDKSDFAFISIDLAIVSEETLASIQVVQYDKNVTDNRGDEVYTLGKHYKKGVLYFSGKCLTSEYSKSFDRMFGNYTFITDFSVVPGTSGGGVYNEEGYILGICSKGNEKITTFIAIEEIIEFYEVTMK